MKAVSPQPSCRQKQLITCSSHIFMLSAQHLQGLSLLRLRQPKICTRQKGPESMRINASSRQILIHRIDQKPASAQNQTKRGESVVKSERSERFKSEGRIFEIVTVAKSHSLKSENYISAKNVPVKACEQPSHNPEAIRSVSGRLATSPGQRPPNQPAT